MKPLQTTARFCDHCKERIIWATTDEGNVPLNPTPYEAGGYLAYQAASGAWIGRVNTIGPKAHVLERPYQSHNATCRGKPRPNESEAPDVV